MKRFALLLAFLLILSISCLALTPTEEPPITSPPTLTSEPVMRIATTDPDQPIEAQARETFEIVIDSNPSTGYHWDIVGELNGVEFVSTEYTADEPVMPGSGGVDVWTFKAVSAGQTEITLGSYPPDPNVTEPAQTVTFNIVIK
ncbi:MAG TPA: protease inhibitor I42 family protein [Anaerolineales bacterium]|nr:protease inhibitor I42 family protein [Anaerolineales bacterium]HNQ95339.1 protease inhibitor I42 family protein [Anaerolineales bacterium]HNS61995.1 protease inhibitor I42 family protein [Anaerolineales bacterium]